MSGADKATHGTEPAGRAGGFNLSKWALDHAPLTRYLMLVLMVLGAFAYFQLGQDEDPPFTFRAMVVRTYWPGATAQQENIQGIGSYLHDNVNGSVTRWELCAFNNLCRDKYERLDMEWRFAETELMTKEDLAQIEEWARASGFDPQRVLVTGAAKVEN